MQGTLRRARLSTVAGSGRGNAGVGGRAGLISQVVRGVRRRVWGCGLRTNLAYRRGGEADGKENVRRDRRDRNTRALANDYGIRRMSLPTATRPSLTPLLPATGQLNCIGTSMSGTAASRVGSLKTHLPSPVQPAPPSRLGEIPDATPRCRLFQPPQGSSCYAVCCNCSMATGTPMTQSLAPMVRRGPTQCKVPAGCATRLVLPRHLQPSAASSTKPTAGTGSTIATYE
jgi:hypothetical protein